jgi:hypothetical protein
LVDSSDNGQWWSLIQIAAWLSTRSEKDVKRVADLEELRELTHAGLRPVGVDGAPAVPIQVALSEVLRAAADERLSLFGHERGQGRLVKIPVRARHIPVDMDGKACIRDADMYRPRSTSWNYVVAKPSECRSVWLPRSQGDKSLQEMIAWTIWEKKRRIKIGKEHTGPDMVIAMRRKFPGLEERAARAIYRDAVPKDLKRRGRKKGQKGAIKSRQN